MVATIFHHTEIWSGGFMLFRVALSPDDFHAGKRPGKHGTGDKEQSTTPSE
jgi:hypothetical protein